MTDADLVTLGFFILLGVLAGWLLIGWLEERRRK